jgi:hypothetical protein
MRGGGEYQPMFYDEIAALPDYFLHLESPLLLLKQVRDNFKPASANNSHLQRKMILSVLCSVNSMRTSKTH